MKRLIVILTFLTSGLFGQDNPILDSVDYFLRNKIKVIHEYHSSWYYGHPWAYKKSSFDKKSRVLRLDSIKFKWDDPNSSWTKFMKPGSLTTFGSRDTIFRRENNFNDTIKHFYDKNKRLTKTLFIATAPKQSEDGSLSIGENAERVPHITTTIFLYADSVSKKIKRTITESPYFISVTNFYYDKTLLSIMATLDSNKLVNKITFETTTFDYYPDKKLRKQTRRVSSDYCPDICEGTIEYKYETEFKNDSTPSGIEPIPYITLLKIENKTKSEVYAELYGYPSNNKPKRHTWIVPHIGADSTFEIAYDSRVDKGIFPRKQSSYWYYKKNDFTTFQIHVFSKPINYVQYSETQKDTLFFEKINIAPLFKTPKTITITEKK
ncbi:MAG: hypothetical protein V4635_05955 [Bacteroidota bacterium]